MRGYGDQDLVVLYATESDERVKSKDGYTHTHIMYYRFSTQHISKNICCKLANYYTHASCIMHHISKYKGVPIL